MKLEVGMYVRSKINGMISKITDIEQFEELGQIMERYILDNNYNKGFCSTEKDSVKASNNIIDLIEVGDYVNGEKVTSIIPPDILADEELDHAYISSLNGEEVFEDIEIQSIVTREQFESMKYEL